MLFCVSVCLKVFAEMILFIKPMMKVTKLLDSLIYYHFEIRNYLQLRMRPFKILTAGAWWCQFTTCTPRTLAIHFGASPWFINHNQTRAFPSFSRFHSTLPDSSASHHYVSVGARLHSPPNLAQPAYVRVQSLNLSIIKSARDPDHDRHTSVHRWGVTTHLFILVPHGPSQLLPSHRFGFN